MRTQEALAKYDMVLQVRVPLVALYAAIYWATEKATFFSTLFIGLVVAALGYGYF